MDTKLAEFPVKGWEYQPTEPSCYRWTPGYVHVDCPIFDWDSDDCIPDGEAKIFAAHFKHFSGGGYEVKYTILITCPVCQDKFTTTEYDYEPPES